MGILIVDDSQDNCLVIKSMLKAAGHKDIEMVHSAREALAFLGVDRDGRDGGQPRDTGVDLILMDIMMPEMDGIEALRIIKGNERLRDIPIIMVTALTDTDNLQKAFEAGAADYITKPVRMAEMLARVGAALRLKQEIEARKQHELALMEEASKLEETIRELEKMSNIDPLTGVANRRRFDTYLETEWKRGIRNGATLSLIMIDIDCFKKFNDFYGHQKGDQCLRNVARSLSKCLSRPADLLCRYGGEEFAVILPETTLEGAVVLAEKMRKAVENLQIPHETSRVIPVVTVSLGVASLYPSPARHPGELVDAADRALYLAKEGGRNQVRIQQAKLDFPDGI